MVAKFVTFVAKSVPKASRNGGPIKLSPDEGLFQDWFCDKSGEFANHLLNSLRTIGPLRRLPADTSGRKRAQRGSGKVSRSLLEDTSRRKRGTLRLQGGLPEPPGGPMVRKEFGK